MKSLDLNKSLSFEDVCVCMSVFKTTQTQWKEDDQTEQLGYWGFLLWVFFLGRGLRDGVSWSGDLVVGRRVQRARGCPLCWDGSPGLSPKGFRRMKSWVRSDLVSRWDLG